MENGREHYSTSLDRIEGIIKAIASRPAEIEDEFMRLLKAQVVMQDEMNRSTKVSNARMDRVEQTLAEAGNKLNALITLTDQHLREHRDKP